jgi:hypothetical protein
MSIKGFLEVQEMQEGGPAMFTPFAVDPEGSPRRRIAPTYQPNPPPTIALPPIAPITPTPTPEQLNISPDPNYMGSIDMTLAQAGATKHGLGTLNPHWNQEFLSTLESEGRPETDLSRALDRGFKALATPALAVATLAVPAIAPMTGLFSAVTGRGGGGILSSALSSAMGGKQTPTNLGTSQFQTQTAPQATTSAIPQTPAQQFAAATGNSYALGDGRSTAASAPVGYTLPGGGFGSTVTPAAAAAAAPAAPTAAQVGSEMFGNVYGMGGEISQNFAIGGKGSFTSFSHYGAGISQADEISIVTNAAPGVFDSAADGKDTVDTMVSNGYNEAQITAVAQGELDEGELDSLAQSVGMEDAGVSGGDGGVSVICQELYDQGLLDQHTYSIEQKFGEYIRINDPALLEGYHSWACSVVNAMRKSKTITHVIRIIAYPVIKHIAYKMGRPSKTILGAVMFNVGAFVCRRLAKKETVYA